MAAEPNFVPPYELAAQQRQYPELLKYTEHVRQLDPRGTPRLWYYTAMANHNLGHNEIPKASAEKSLAMDPLHTEPNTDQLLAVILVAQHDYPGAWNTSVTASPYYPSARMRT